MRGRRSLPIVLAAALALQAACTRVPSASNVSRPEAPTRAEALGAGIERGVIAPMLARLPPGAERCSLVVPERVLPDRRALVALASQSGPLPWSPVLPVRAYVRAERTSSLGSRAVREYLRLGPITRAEVRSRVEHELARPIAWEGEAAPPMPCAAELTCRPLRARFVEGETLELALGDWEEQPSEVGPVSSSCGAALARRAGPPSVFEVGLRAASIEGGELRSTEVVLALADAGIVRTTVRTYASDKAAERARGATYRGQEELGSIAGVPASSLGTREGAALVQPASVRFDDLALVLDDRRRLDDALARRAAAPDPARVDPGDSDAVRALVDRSLRVGERPADGASLRALDALLTEARARAPSDDGLSRRHYALRLLAGDAAGALTIARAARTRGGADALAWGLRLRAVLARLDEAALRAELRRLAPLSPESAARLARELVHRVAHGEDYERAEWALLSAYTLEADARRGSRTSLALRLPVAELPRLLAYLAAGSARADLGVRLLLVPAAVVEGPPLGSAVTLPSGRAGVLFALGADDDARLVALGHALARASGEGALALTVELSASAAGRSVLGLSGRREGAMLRIEQGPRALTALRWHAVERLLAAPLRLLVGAHYPPDELVVTARDAAEADAVVRAAESAERVRCARDGLAVRCRGPLSDEGAARRALLAVARALLAPEGRALWSGAE